MPSKLVAHGKLCRQGPKFSLDLITRIKYYTALVLSMLLFLRLCLLPPYSWPRPGRKIKVKLRLRLRHLSALSHKLHFYNDPPTSITNKLEKHCHSRHVQCVVCFPCIFCVNCPFMLPYVFIVDFFGHSQGNRRLRIEPAPAPAPAPVPTCTWIIVAAFSGKSFCQSK